MANWISKKECAQLLGEEAMDNLLQKFGGFALYVPLKANKKHRIAACVGYLGMAKLVREFGGSCIMLPNTLLRRKKRNLTQRKVEKLLEEGMSVAQIALRLELSERHVFHVKKQLKDAAAQQATGME